MNCHSNKPLKRPLYVVSAINQVKHYRHRASNNLVISASRMFAVYESAKLPTSYFLTRGGSGNGEGHFLLTLARNYYSGNSAGAACKSV